MTQSTKQSLLQEIDGRINIDIDSLDNEFLRSLSITPNDQTCNPRWLSVQVEDPSSSDLLKATALELQGEGFLAVGTRLAVRLCRQNIKFIKGRVFVQTSPSAAYDSQKTLDHAHLVASEFERAGIPKDRYCIKIMATGPGLTAAKILNSEGISTLGTGVFCVAQAVACSQAGCLFISPYYNEIRTFLDPSLWPDVVDPALEHPFSHRIAQIVHAYQDLFNQTGNQQPLIKNAGFLSYREVIATAELGCHSATLSKANLEELQDIESSKVVVPAGVKVASLRRPYSDDAEILSPRLTQLLASDPLATLRPGDTWSPTNIRLDYLANEGKVLEDVLAKDEAATRMLRDALELFMYSEAEMRKVIEAVWSRASL